MSRPDSDYIRYDPFEGDLDVDIKCRTIKVVKVRKEQPCWIGLNPYSDRHMIKPGERARFEKAIVDGEWHSCYVCLSCIDKWMKEVGL